MTHKDCNRLETTNLIIEIDDQDEMNDQDKMNNECWWTANMTTYRQTQNEQKKISPKHKE